MAQLIPEPQVKEWLRHFGIQMPNGCAVDLQALDAASLPGAVGELRPPLVLKAFGPGVVHKSELGAVRLGVAGVAQALAAAREMRAKLAERGIAAAGFYVEEQASAGAEVIVGAVADPVFGTVLLAGLGGVWTEALGDTALRICPVTEADARSMLSGLRGRAVLSGLRGSPAVDVDALVRVLLAVGGPGGVAETLGGALAEFELNPVVCTPNGAVAVDARLMLTADGHLPAADGRAPAVSAAARREPPTDFTRLFAPRGVAVAGASAKKPGFGNMFLRFYRRAGYAGKLIAVHPEATEIDGVPAVPSLAEAGGEIDYALIAVPAGRCAEVVKSAGGIPFVQVMSGGFRETGAEGAALEDGLAAAARAAGVRLLGPNCMGVYSPAGGQTFIGGEPGQPGRIAVISQSGGMAGEIIRAGEHRGLRFAAVATVGNSVDVTPAELLAWFGGQAARGQAARGQAPSAAGLYMEDPRDGRDLFETLRELRGRLPVVALIGGRSRQGQRAAASHTGGMVNDARVWTALAAQTGITLVSSQDDLIGVLDFFDQHATRMAGTPGQSEAQFAPHLAAGGREAEGTVEGVLIVGPSGGASVLAADVFDAAGVAIPPLSGAARDALTSLGLGAGSSLANPLEIPAGPGGRVRLVRDAVQAIFSHHAYSDLVVHLNVLSFFTFGNSVESLLAYVACAGGLQETLGGARVTLVLRNVDCAPAGVERDARALARASGVPVYRSMEAAAPAVAAGQRHARAAAPLYLP